MQREPKTERLPHLVVVCLLLALVITVFQTSPIPSPTSETSPNDAGVKEIAPGSSVHDTLEARAKKTFSVVVNGGSLLRFSIDKGDLLLTTTLYGPTGEKLLEHVSHDFEVVDLSFPAQTAGTYRIEILSRERQDAQPFNLNVQPLTPLTEANLKDSEARQVMARAEVSRAESNETAFRQAIEQYDAATQIWSSSDLANASNASLKAGDLLLDLSEYPEALKRYQSANSFAERTGDWLERAKTLGRMARAENYSRNSLAQQHVDQALDLFRPHERDPSRNIANALAETQSIQAQILASTGAFEKASNKFEEALKTLQGDRKVEATALLLLGQINGSTGYLEEAVAHSSRARELFGEIGNKRGEGLALINLGLANSFRDESQAMDSYRKASSIFRLLGDKTSEGVALNALGQASETLHDDSALTYYEQALALFEEKDFKEAQTINLLRIGTLYFDKDLEKALTYDQRCLALSQQIGNARFEALARIEIARVYTAQRHYELASAEYQKVLQFYESSKDPRAQATALNAYGEFLLQTGEKQKALESFERALSLSDTVHDKELHIAALYGLALAHQQLGSPEQALPFIQASLKEIEEFRASVESPDFRTSYFAGVQRNYKLCIDILMQLERQHPGNGRLTEAFLLSENTRARLLRELVIESHARKHEGASSELLQKERELRAQFRAQAQIRMMVAPDERNSAEAAERDRKLDEIKANFQEVETKLRQQNFGVSPPEPVTLSEIQHELRDDSTMLLEFSLGEERSYLFLVTLNSIEAYELPARKLVEDTVQEFMESIATRDGQIDNQKAARLTQMLFGPVADKLGNRRLLMVKEGGLQALAFDVLPAPAGQTNGPAAMRSLVETNEIVFEPSMSTLAAIRKPRARNDSLDKLVAVIADPVLAGSDERVHNASNSSGTARAATNSNSDPQRSSEISVRDGVLTRLTHASEEIDAIVAAAPWGTTMVAKDFAANREKVTSPELGQYQIVHFATHGVFNNQHPDLSGIVLTMVDRNGATRDGMMTLPDIYNLNLSAELTVLSACETALGKDVKGEGFVGLTHSFLSAGSKSVVASLWKVDDRATAIFMAKFYEAMLQEGLAPAAALREAKLRMRREKQWSAPYYWAGFVLQGEYENHIQVDRHSSMRLAIVLVLLLSLSAAALVSYRRQKRQFSPSQSS